ncbi:MAG: MotA/TolQ/ExbB proton channel family protein [Porticoccaceae bacterium]|nr:MotA/TolQ/ExbB proton channel family protein [Porticoccaceae bacterium]
MDIATIIGLVGALVAINLAVTDPTPLMNANSAYLVVLGTFAVTLFRSSMGEFLNMFIVSLKMFRYKMDKPEDLIDRLVELAGIARKDGMIALENEEIPNRFLAKGISALVDGNEAGFIRSSLERDMFMTARRHETGRGTLQAAGDIAPSMGMIGTLIGLVNLLQNMASNPEGIGPAMALALLTTLYGSLLANIVFIPIAMKLENHAKNEEMNSQLIIEGVLFIQGGGNPRLLGDLLSAFLNPKKNKKRANAEPAAAE